MLLPKCVVLSSTKDITLVYVQVEFQFFFPILLYEDVRFSHSHYRSHASLKCKHM